MSSNAFGAFSSPVASRGPGSGIAKKKKKRKKKKAKKSGASGADKNDDARVLGLVARGYDREDIHNCFDKMFEAGEDLMDDKALIKRLNAMKNPPAESKSASVAGGEAAAAASPSSKSMKAVKPRRSQQTTADSGRHSGETKNSSDSKSSNSAGHNGAGAAAPVSGSSGGPAAPSASTATSTAAPEEAPLADRLEQATEMPVAVVLPVLTKWCRNYESDRATLFESNALGKLFEHYLQDLIKGDTDGASVVDKYEKPMSELLQLALSTSPSLSKMISSQLKTFVMSVHNMSLSSAERSRVCQAFSAHLVSRVRNFHRATSYDESLPGKLATLDQNLKQNETTAQEVEAALGADPSSLARMFELRDLRSERAMLKAKKSKLLEFINGGGEESVGRAGGAGGGGDRKGTSRRTQLVSVDGKTDQALLISVGFESEAVSKAAGSQASATALKSEIAEIEAKHRKKLGGVSSKISKAAGEADALRSRIADLQAQLKECEESLASSLVQKAKLEASQADMEKAFEKQMASLNASNSGLVGHIRRGEAQTSIVEQLRALDRCVDASILEAGENLSGAQHAQRNLLSNAAGGSLSKSRMEAVISVTEYAKAERACLDRIRARMQSTKEEADKLKKEIVVVEQLGLKKVEKQMQHSIEEHTQNYNEDAGLVDHLEKHARKTLEGLKGIVSKIVSQSAGNVNARVALAIQDAKDAFVSLACCGADADGWKVPEVERKGSFDADKANALGLSALLPKGYDKSQGASSKAKAPAAKPTSVFKGWGAPATSGKSLAEIQREEMAKLQ